MRQPIPSRRGVAEGRGVSHPIHERNVCRARQKKTQHKLQSSIDISCIFFEKAFGRLRYYLYLCTFKLPVDLNLNFMQINKQPI